VNDVLAGNDAASLEALEQEIQFGGNVIQWSLEMRDLDLNRLACDLAAWMPADHAAFAPCGARVPVGEAFRRELLQRADERLVSAVNGR
jgi:hypothetical protein